MADFNTPEEIARFIENVTEQYEKGFISAKEFNDAMKDANIGIRGYTQNLRNSMQQLGTSFKALGKDVYDGKKGVGVFNNTLDSGANALAAYALKFGPAGVAVGAFTKALTAFITASLKQSDLLFDSYEKISRAGVIGAGAMSEVFDNMLKFGYTVNELGELGDLLARNSKNFGLFFSSALQGARTFSRVADQIQNSDIRQQFFRLGLGVTEINDGIAGFVAQQGKLGQIQGRTVDELRKGAVAYIKELDVLTKLTGLTRQEQEEAREQALQIREFYAGLQDLGPDAQEQALQAFTVAFARGGPKLAAEMASQFNGFITGASDLFITTGGASMRAFSKDFFARGGTAAQSFQLLKDSISPEVMAVTKGLNQFGASLGVDLRPLVMITQNADPLQKVLDQLTDEQYKLLTGTDRATAAQARARDSQIKTAQNLQEFVKLGVAPATQALAFFTEALEKLTSFIPGAGRLKKEREEAAKALPAERKVGLEEKIIQVESGGQNIANRSGPGGAPSSTAFGVAQITKDTFQGLVKKASSTNPLYGKTFEDMKADVGIQREALGQLLDQNRAYLSKLGLSTTDSALYLAHFLGAPVAAKVLSLGDSAPLYGAITPDQIKSNPMLKDMRTIGDIKAWADSKMGGGGYQYGGIASGPTSGYQATLHGTEAVVPLPDGRTIPVEVRNQDSGLLNAQLDKLDELIRIMQAQVSVSNKILQAAA